MATLPPERGLAGAVLLALALLLPTPGSTRDAPLAVGDQAPDVMLPDQHGHAVRLSEALRGRDFVVLAFYVKAFTGG